MLTSSCMKPSCTLQHAWLSLIESLQPLCMYVWLLCVTMWRVSKQIEMPKKLGSKWRWNNKQWWMNQSTILIAAYGFNKHLFLSIFESRHINKQPPGRKQQAFDPNGIPCLSTFETVHCANWVMRSNSAVRGVSPRELDKRSWLFYNCVSKKCWTTGHDANNTQHNDLISDNTTKKT